MFECILNIPVILWITDILNASKNILNILKTSWIKYKIELLIKSNLYTISFHKETNVFGFVSFIVIIKFMFLFL